MPPTEARAVRGILPSTSVHTHQAREKKNGPLFIARILGLESRILFGFFYRFFGFFRLIVASIASTTSSSRKDSPLFSPLMLLFRVYLSLLVGAYIPLANLLTIGH